MSAKIEKLALFIDGANLHATLRHTYLWGYRAINMEEPNGQEWEIE